jgi:hypothetical protein
LEFGRLGIVAMTVVLIAGEKGVVVGAQSTRKVPIPAPSMDEPKGAAAETAVFAGGCFWGVQTTFQRIKGVTATTAGYSGGSAATYDQVSSGLVAASFRSIKKHLSRFQIDPGHASSNEICLAESAAQRSADMAGFQAAYRAPRFLVVSFRL